MAEDIVYSRVPPDRFQDVISHLRCSFFADEPLNKSLSLCSPGQPHAELETYSLNVLKQELSLMATYDGKVVGACLSGNPLKDEHNECEDPKLKKILTFIEKMENEADFGDEIPKENILDLKIVSVDNKMRGLRIATSLYEYAERLAIEDGYKLFRAQATSLFSQKMFEKFGWQTIREIRYNEYPSQENKLFNVEPPHESYKVMIKRLG